VDAQMGDTGGVEQMTRHSRNVISLSSHSLNSLLTSSQECGIPRLLFEEPGGGIVTWAKDAGIRERWRVEWATEEQGGDGDSDEASEYHYEQAGCHGGGEKGRDYEKPFDDHINPTEVLTGERRVDA